MLRRVMFALLLGLVACVATGEDAAPSEDELGDADAWADASDGKSDLPGTFSSTIAWLEDFYTNRMSAVWNHQEHPASAAAAKARIRGLLGNTDLSRARFTTSVQRLHAGPIDHSEIDIVLPASTDASKKVVRLIGDPKGAGVFLDKAVFQTALSPPLCLTWSELETAIDAAYLPGAYALDYVCHTVTEHVLRALGIGSSKFSSQVRTYSIARYVWGPALPSLHSQNPADWPESRSCH